MTAQSSSSGHVLPAHWCPYRPAAQTSLEECPALDSSVNSPGHIWSSIWMLTQFNAASGDMQFEFLLPWFNLGGNPIGVHFGVDGISILMVLLTTFLTPLAILSTWKAVAEKVKGFMTFFLLLEVGMLGVFLSLDMVLFYIFWEFTLIPMYFLIGLWGGERRVYAAVKFFLYTFAGSILMLAGILWIGLQYGSFDLSQLSGAGLIPVTAQLWLFGAFGLAFAIKVPMFPLHSWLPDAHTEAPTAGSVILAGVLLKMGAYGFLRFNLPLFPNASVQLAPWMAGLAVIGIIYGAAVAYRQKDVKRLVAYSSISHLGFVVLGIFALNLQGIQGAILQMVNHGLSTGALFLVVGLLYERRHTRLIRKFRRFVESYASDGHPGAHHRAFFGWAARSQRLCRGIYHPAGRLQINRAWFALVCRGGHLWSDSGSRLSPPYVPDAYSSVP